MNKLHDIEKDLDWDSVVKHIHSLLPSGLGSFSSGRLNALHFLRLLYIQKLYRLNEMELEDKILDRPSYRRFAGLHASDCPGYSRPLWEFRRRLEESGCLEKALNGFGRLLKDPGQAAPLKMAS